jgi:hypothetical protein
MIAIEMPAAIRPYSMAVAADSSCKKASELRQHDQILGGQR